MTNQALPISSVILSFDPAYAHQKRNAIHAVILIFSMSTYYRGAASPLWIFSYISSSTPRNSRMCWS